MGTALNGTCSALRNFDGICGLDCSTKGGARYMVEIQLAQTACKRFSLSCAYSIKWCIRSELLPCRSLSLLLSVSPCLQRKSRL
mmetsp:Transcript_56435/g.125980  ORF Transcript_56435/g.125980 Transcript_56435/m.125980 type:complete len:84 (-) Transcript_56435:107-358(-)